MSIETERLILRPFTESDAPALLTYLRTPAAHCFQDMKLSSFRIDVVVTSCSQMFDQRTRIGLYIHLNAVNTAVA